MEFQKYNVKEKKKEKKERKRKRKKKKNNNNQKQSHKNYKENIGTKLITNTKKQKFKNLEFGISKIQF